MDIKPVQINIKDKSLYAQIAFLVDNATFLRDVESIRKEYKVDPKMQSDDYFETATDKELSGKRLDLLNKAKFIRRKYKYPPYFDDVVMQVILFHKVNSFEATQAVMHLSSKTTASHDLEIAILITPLSTKKEVVEAFEKTKNMMEDYKKYQPVINRVKKGASENIQRDRSFFWRNLNGESPHDISIKDNKGVAYYLDVKKRMKYAGDLPEKLKNQYNRYLIFIDNYRESVRKAIDRYKENIADI